MKALINILKWTAKYTFDLITVLAMICIWVLFVILTGTAIGQLILNW